MSQAEPDLFVAAWESYRTMVACDYLWHSMVMEALGKLLDRFTFPVHFLDLACGDAKTKLPPGLKVHTCK